MCACMCVYVRVCVREAERDYKNSGEITKMGERERGRKKNERERERENLKFSIIPHSKYRTAIRAVLLYILKKERERERGGGDDFGKDGGKRRRVVFAFSLDCTRAIPSPNNN